MVVGKHVNIITGRDHECCVHPDHIRLGPKPWTEEDERERSKAVEALIIEATRRFHMNRVRAKFNVSQIMKDAGGNAFVRLWAVYKGDESSPENESFSNSTPSGNCDLYITNPAAIEFFEKFAGKYLYLDFTPSEG